MNDKHTKGEEAETKEWRAGSPQEGMTFAESLIKEVSKKALESKGEMPRTNEEIAKLIADVSLAISRAAAEAVIIPTPSPKQERDEPYTSSVLLKCRREQIGRAAIFFSGIQQP